jgi:hypothetical protein
MRYHRAYHDLAVVLGLEPGDKLNAEQLVAVRLEPVVRSGLGSAAVDLHFCRDERWSVVPLVIVDVPMLEARERDPLVWPERAREIGSGIDTDAIGDRVDAWLRELLAQGTMSREQWRVFGNEADEKRFVAAREAGFLGAASYEVVARKAAPYVFARRHARSRDVVVAARDAELGAALLKPVVRKLEILTPNDAAAKWYGIESERSERHIAIVDAANRGRDEVKSSSTIVDLDAGEGVQFEPAPVIPVDSLFDFSGAIRRGEARFSVLIRKERQLREPIVPDRSAIGGSTGRIVFGLRGRALQYGGADVDLAQMIAEAMRDEGFTVDIVDDPQRAAALRPDLIHAFGLADSQAALAYARAAKSLEIPFALHALYDAAALGGYWGATVTPYCFRFMQDETTVASLSALMRDRRLAVNQVVADAVFHPTQPAWKNDIASTLEIADAVFVTGAKEEDALRQISDAANFITLPVPIARGCEPAPITALVGMQPYALMHAPVESTQNQLQAVRAVEMADIPLVIAGPVTDADYASLVRSFAGERVIMIDEPDPATLEGLYRGADVYLDVAWVGCGLARAARALSRGAAPVVSARMPLQDLNLGEFAASVEPGDAHSIARGLGDTWTNRQHEALRFEEIRTSTLSGSGVRDVTTSVVVAYAQAIEKRNNPVLR